MRELLYSNPDYTKTLLFEVRMNGDPAELAILLRQLEGEGGKGDLATHKEDQP
jgi:hypothetical protein